MGQIYILTFKVKMRPISIQLVCIARVLMLANVCEIRNNIKLRYLALANVFLHSLINETWTFPAFLPFQAYLNKCFSI